MIDVDAFLAQREQFLADLDAEDVRLHAALAKIAEARRTLRGSPAPVAGRTRASATGNKGQALAWLREHPGPQRPCAVADALGCSNVAASHLLAELVKDGEVEKLGRGSFQAITAPFDAPAAPAPVEAPRVVDELPRRETPADRMRRVEGSRK